MRLLLSVLLLLTFPKTAIVQPPYTVEEICTTRWGRDVRHVTDDMKLEVLAKVGMTWAQRSTVEIDHIIPRELGGDDVVENLQAQCCIVKGVVRGDAHDKDVLENRLHRMVCAGTLELKVAQVAIWTDWRRALKRYPKQ